MPFISLCAESGVRQVCINSVPVPDSAQALNVSTDAANRCAFAVPAASHSMACRAGCNPWVGPGCRGTRTPSPRRGAGALRAGMHREKHFRGIALQGKSSPRRKTPHSAKSLTAHNLPQCNAPRSSKPPALQSTSQRHESMNHSHIAQQVHGSARHGHPGRVAGKAGDTLRPCLCLRPGARGARRCCSGRDACRRNFPGAVCAAGGGCIVPVRISLPGRTRRRQGAAPHAWRTAVPRRFGALGFDWRRFSSR